MAEIPDQVRNDTYFMELVKEFGIEPVLLGAQIVNFLIILFILKRYMYKPLLGVLQKRKEEIALGLKHAEESQKLLAKTQEEERAILKKAQAESKKIIEDAKHQATELARLTESKIKKQTELMLSEAKAHIAQDSIAAENRIMQNVTKISIQILEKSLSGMMGNKAQQEILEKTIKDLRKKPN